MQDILKTLHIIRVKKQKLEVLKGMSGTLHSGRMTLLLGPPSSGKSTLLKALAGKLKHEDVQVRWPDSVNARFCVC